MKHYLRFSLMLLLIMLMGGVSFAQETESFNFVGWKFDGASDWSQAYTAHTVKGSDVTVNFLKASKQASSSTISDCPVTKGSYITVTLNNQETCTITSIELLLKQWSSKTQTVTLNTSADGKNYTKTTTTSSNFSLTASGLSAKAIKFTFSSTSNQVGVQSIKVTYTKSGSDKTNTTLSFPNLTSKTLLVGETFTATPTLKAGDTDVTGKTLTYKSSDENVATVSDKGVVEAKKPGNTTITANFAGDDTYSASSASYAVKVAVNDIATLKSLITSTDTDNPQSFTLKLTDAVVTYTNKKTAYIQDASGAIYIYASSHGLDANQKINGFADVKVCKYLGLNEITSWTLADDATVTDDGTFTVETVTLADLTNNFDKYESMPVKVAGATVTKNFVSNSGEISQDGTTFVVYNKGTSSVTLGSVGDNIDIVGYPAIYNSTKQLNLWKQSDITKNSSKAATVMAFSESEVKVAAGSKDVTTPTLTLTANGEDILAGKTITYNSTDEEVAMVDETAGNIVLMGKEGSTTITATFAGDDTYAGATASYTLTVSKTATTMAFSESEVKVAVGSEDVTTPTLALTANGEDILTGKTITYSSTDEEVAMVDETTGNIVLMGKEGSTTITATFAGDDTYAGATASYTLTVYDPNKTDVTFDFSTMGYKNTEVVNHVEKDGITLDLTKGGTQNDPKYYTQNSTLRFYKDGGTLTVTAPTGKAIIKVDFTLGKNISITDITSLDLTVNKGTITGENSSYTWTGNSTSVVFTANATIQMKELVISYTNVSDDSYDYALSDESDTYTPSTFTDKSVKIKRSLKANQLNTICLPFALTSEQISTTFGEGTEVYRLTSSTDNTMNFTSKETIEEGYPYLIMPQNDVNELIFDQVSSEGKSADLDITDGDFALCGTFGPATLKTDGTELFLAAGGILKKPTQGSNSKIKGFRAYFSVPANTNDAKISLGGFETSIDNISIDGMKLKNNQVYNLNGQLVGNSLNGLAKGIYLMNGKKYVVK